MQYEILSTSLQTQRMLLEQGIEDSNLKATVLNYVRCYRSSSTHHQLSLDYPQVWRCDADGRLIAETLSESFARLFASLIFHSCTGY